MRVAIALGVCLAGCTLLNDPGMHMGSARDTPSDAARVLYDDFCDRYAELACESFDACCTTIELPAACLDTVTRVCTDTIARNLLRDTRTGYDPVIAATVLEEGRALASSCDPGILGWSRTSILRMLTGSRAPGAVCTPDPIDGGFDYPALLSCAEDNACIFNGVDRWTCQTRVEVGGACFLDTDCQSGLFCDRATSQCAARLPVGAACNADADGCEDICICDDRATCAAAHCVAPSANAIYCNLFTQ